MADDDAARFNLRLLRQELKLNALDPRGTAVGGNPDVARGLQPMPAAVPNYQLRQPRLGPPVSANGLERGGNVWQGDYLRDVRAAIRARRDGAVAAVEAKFNQRNPANVIPSDLKMSDHHYSDKRLVALVRSIAKEFQVHPALLAEHMAAEVTGFEDYSRIPKGVSFEEWVKTRRLTTSASGLDDWVKERNDIEKSVPGAKTIPVGTRANSIYPESIVRKYQRLGEPIPAKYEKPQVEFSMYDCMRATAAYLKYKENIMRGGVGKANFDDLPQPVKFQLVRYGINPTGAGTGDQRGTRHWIALTKKDDLEELFSFSDRTYKQSSNVDVLENAMRRTTIHSAISVHLAETIFAE